MIAFPGGAFFIDTNAWLLGISNKRSWVRKYTLMPRHVSTTKRTSIPATRSEGAGVNDCVAWVCIFH